MRRKDGRNQEIMLQPRECDAEETLVPLFLLGGSRTHPWTQASRRRENREREGRRPQQRPTTPSHSLTYTPHRHSPTYPHPQLEQVDGMPGGSFAMEQETPVAAHHHHHHHHAHQPSLHATGFAPEQQQLQQQRPHAPPRRPSSGLGHLQTGRNVSSSSKKNSYPFTPVPSPSAQFQHQRHHHQPMQDENAHPMEQSGGSSVSSSSTSSSSYYNGGSSSSSSGKKPVAPRINVRLMPQNSATAARVRQAGYNPKLELSTPLSKRVGFFLGHLATKWSDVPGIASLSLRLAASPTQQLEEHVALRSLGAHFAAAKRMDCATGAGGVAPSAVLQLHYVLRQDIMNEWHPEENSLFDAFAATGLDQLPASASTLSSAAVAPPVVNAFVGQQVQAQPPLQQQQQQQQKRRKRVSLTTGDASNRNETFVNAATLVISTPAPTKFSSSTPSSSSSSSSSFESSGDSSVSQTGQPGSEKKRRRIRPTLLPPGEVVATSPSFLQAQCGIGSFTSESSRQSSFSNSGDDSQQ